MTSNQEQQILAITMMEGELATLKKIRKQLLKQMRECESTTNYLQAKINEVAIVKAKIQTQNSNVLSRIKSTAKLLKQVGEDNV